MKEVDGIAGHLWRGTIQRHHGCPMSELGTGGCFRFDP